MVIKSTSKKSILIKICGITKISQAKAISQLKVDAIGVIGVESSPRFVPKEKCQKIFEEVEKNSSNIERVLVIANKEIKKIDFSSNESSSPTVIQLHGNESVDYCHKLKIKFPEIFIWKAFRLKSILDLREIRRYENFVDAILLDAWDNKSLGGTGKRIPIELLVNRTFNTPWILAGGISYETIPEIFSKIKPDGIDASSLLETSPGIKDIAKVKSLIRVIKEDH